MKTGETSARTWSCDCLSPWRRPAGDRVAVETKNGLFLRQENVNHTGGYDITHDQTQLPQKAQRKPQIATSCFGSGGTRQWNVAATRLLLITEWHKLQLQHFMCWKKNNKPHHHHVFQQLNGRGKEQNHAKPVCSPRLENMTQLHLTYKLRGGLRAVLWGFRLSCIFRAKLLCKHNWLTPLIIPLKYYRCLHQNRDFLWSRWM